jgi:drug/metabolite transporter (DMT)-like permease
MLLGLAWGSSIVATRFSVGQFNSITLSALRLFLASLAYALVYLLSGRKRRFPRDPQLWRHAALLGVLGTAIPMLSIVSSMQYLSATVTSILLTLGPVITVILAHYFLEDEPLTSRKGAGAATALGGALLLAARGESGLGDTGNGSLVGYGLILLAMLSANYSAIYIRRRMRSLDPVDVASVRMFVAAVIVIPLTSLTVGFDLQRVDAQGVSALVYAALVGTFLAQGFSFYVTQRFGATAAATALYLTPVAAGLGGVLILDETITTGMMAGMAMIAVGIWLISRSKAPKGEPVTHTGGGVP